MLNIKGSQVVAKAKTYKGKYKKYCNKFTKHFAGHYGVPKSGKIKAGYCTMFCGYVLDMLGAFSAIPSKQLGKKWWNTQALLKWYKKHHKEWVTTDPKKAKVGALAFKKVGSTSKKSTGHTSIFIKYENGYVYTIDGNVGGGVVTRKKSPAWYVAFVNLPYAPETTTYKVTTKGSPLNVREKPNKDGKVIRKLENGSEVNVLSVKDGWATLKDGGYCSTRYLKKV